MQSQAHSPKIRDSAEKRKMFLQCFLSQGILNAREVKNLLKKCDVQVDSKEEMAKYVQNANASIAFVNLEIKKGIQEEDGASFYCLVNTVETSISRMLSTYSPNELELFKKLESDGKISLSVRSIVELDQYLKDMYQEVIKMCYICTKICLLGEICPKCGIKIHKKCAQTLFDNRTEKKCPDRHCRALWE
uniref:Non-structural maintenance of chromosomes element 1 homolog n=2 Tax=Arion vulgaris TaxID=1028688 RepID=A0A0B6ZQ70_9EUPU